MLGNNAWHRPGALAAPGLFVDSLKEAGTRIDSGSDKVKMNIVHIGGEK